MLIVNLICIPVDLCFYHLQLDETVRTNFDIIDQVINLFFIADLCANFRRTYRIEETNDLRTDVKDIASRYMKGWALFDCIGAMPWAASLLKTDSPAWILSLALTNSCCCSTSLVGCGWF